MVLFYDIFLMFCGNSDEEMVRMYNTLLKMTTRVIFQILTYVVHLVRT